MGRVDSLTEGCSRLGGGSKKKGEGGACSREIGRSGGPKTVSAADVRTWHKSEGAGWWWPPCICAAAQTRARVILSRAPCGSQRLTSAMYGVR